MSGLDSARVGRDARGKILIAGAVLNHSPRYMRAYYSNYVLIQLSLKLRGDKISIWFKGVIFIYLCANVSRKKVTGRGEIGLDSVELTCQRGKRINPVWCLIEAMVH